MLKPLAVIFVALLFLFSAASATVLRISGPDEVGEGLRFNISVKSTVSNLAGFQITIRAEDAEFVEAHKGDAIEDWAFSYKVRGDEIEIIGFYSIKPVSGTAMELSKITFIPYENTTFVIDRKNSKLVDVNEEEIKIDRFYNHSVRVYRYGDVNMDGTVDVRDLIRLKKIILMEEEKTVTSDLNDDGEVNILDFVRLINRLVK